MEAQASAGLYWWILFTSVAANHLNSTKLQQELRKNEVFTEKWAEIILELCKNRRASSSALCVTMACKAQPLCVTFSHSGTFDDKLTPLHLSWRGNPWIPQKSPFINLFTSRSYFQTLISNIKFFNSWFYLLELLIINKCLRATWSGRVELQRVPPTKLFPVLLNLKMPILGLFYWYKIQNSVLAAPAPAPAEAVDGLFWFCCTAKRIFCNFRHLEMSGDLRLVGCNFHWIH